MCCIFLLPFKSRRILTLADVGDPFDLTVIAPVEGSCGDRCVFRLSVEIVAVRRQLTGTVSPGRIRTAKSAGSDAECGGVWMLTDCGIGLRVLTAPCRQGRPARDSVNGLDTKWRKTRQTTLNGKNDE